MRISPCIDTIYRGTDWEIALKAIKNLGYKGFEFWHTDGYDIEKMAELSHELELEVVNFDADEIPLTVPKERASYVAAFEKNVIAANQLSCKRITALSGNDTGKSRAEQRKSIIDGMKEIAPIAEQNDITIVIEASNRRVNRPNNFLTSADEAFEIIDRVDSKHVKMLYDIYHQQISEGDLLSRILPNIEKIGHFHAAGVPNRHELSDCEINYDYVLRQINNAGYTGWIGLEYFPAFAPEVGLEDLKKYLEI